MCHHFLLSIKVSKLPNPSGSLGIQFHSCDSMSQEFCLSCQSVCHLILGYQTLQGERGKAFLYKVMCHLRSRNYRKCKGEKVGTGNTEYPLSQLSTRHHATEVSLSLWGRGVHQRITQVACDSAMCYLSLFYRAYKCSAHR